MGGDHVDGNPALQPGSQPVIDNAKNASKLDRPFLLALQVVSELPIIGLSGAVRGALLGTTIQVLDRDHREAGIHRANDGVWQHGGHPSSPGLSALLLHEGELMRGSLPELYIHPSPLRRLDASHLPFRTVAYTLGDSDPETVTPSRATWRGLMGLPDEWPGPEDPFKGVNTDEKPGPVWWSPTDVD